MDSRDPTPSSKSPAHWTSQPPWYGECHPHRRSTRTVGDKIDGRHKPPRRTHQSSGQNPQCKAPPLAQRLPRPSKKITVRGSPSHWRRSMLVSNARWRTVHFMVPESRNPVHNRLSYCACEGREAFARLLDPAWPMSVESARARSLGEAYF